MVILISVNIFTIHRAIRPCTNAAASVSYTHLQKERKAQKTWIEGIRRSMSGRELNDKNCNDRQQWWLGIGQRRKTF